MAHLSHLNPSSSSDSRFPHTAAAPNNLLILGIRRPPAVLGYPGLKPVFESPGYFLQVSHAAGSGGLSSLGFHAPVVCRLDSMLDGCLVG